MLSQSGHSFTGTFRTATRKPRRFFIGFSKAQISVGLLCVVLPSVVVAGAPPCNNLDQGLLNGCPQVTALHRILIHNACDLPVQFAIDYQDTGRVWQNLYWFSVDANSQSYATDSDNNYIETAVGVLYYSARTQPSVADSQIWSGDENSSDDITLSVENRNLRYRRVTFDKTVTGDFKIAISCDTNEVFVKNSCDLPILVAITFIDLIGQKQTSYWYNFAAGERSHILAHGLSMVTRAHGVWTYARINAPNVNYSWTGYTNRSSDSTFSFAGESHLFRWRSIDESTPVEFSCPDR